MKAVPTAIAHRAIIPLRLRKTKQLTSQPARLQVRERRIVQMRHQTIPTETKSRAGKLRALLRIRPKPPDADQPNSRRICGNGARIRTNRAPPPHTHTPQTEGETEAQRRGLGWDWRGRTDRIPQRRSRACRGEGPSRGRSFPWRARRTASAAAAASAASPQPPPPAAATGRKAAGRPSRHATAARRKP